MTTAEVAKLRFGDLIYQKYGLLGVVLTAQQSGNAQVMLLARDPASDFSAHDWPVGHVWSAFLTLDVYTRWQRPGVPW